MPTVISHPVAALALSSLFPRGSLSPEVIAAGALCSIVPDVDVIGFSFGIRYGDLFGHRGFTHSVFFAAVLSGTVTYFLGSHRPVLTFLFLFLATLSHGILDAFTNGGLGIAFLSPFSNQRFFLPWQPIDVSPIGAMGFFSLRGFQVLLSEVRWVWAPSAILFAASHLLRRAAL